MNIDHTIYMDYQASTPINEDVLQAMLPYFTHEYGNPHSADHVMGWRASKAIDEAKEKVAAAIGAHREEIIFTSGATESNNHAIISSARAIKDKNKRILIGAIEHKCVVEAAEFVSKEYGFPVDLIPVNQEGFIDVDAYKSLLKQDVAIVSIMFVNNEIGTIQDIKMLSHLAKEHGAIFHCDAAQCLMAKDIDVKDLDVDLLSLSGHKIYGPKGIGALYVSQDLAGEIGPIIHGGAQQNGLRAGTLPTALCVGFGVAIEAITGSDDEKNKVRDLKKQFLNALSKKVVFEINGPKDYSLCHPGNINIFFPQIDSHNLLMRLQPMICASSGSACNSGNIESSYVIKALGFGSKRSENSVRFSIGSKTTTDEVMQAVELISKAIYIQQNGT